MAGCLTAFRTKENLSFLLLVGKTPFSGTTTWEVWSQATVRRYLFSHGFRYRKNVSTLPGKPDIVLPKYKTCIFVNGCFWHKHEGCRYFVWPKNNAKFWEAKINGNAERDLRQQNELQAIGWNVIVVWKCELKKPLFDNTMSSVEDKIRRNV